MTADTWRDQITEALGQRCRTERDGIHRCHDSDAEHRLDAVMPILHAALAHGQDG